MAAERPRSGVLGSGLARRGTQFAQAQGTVGREASYGEQLGAMSLNRFEGNIDAAQGLVQKALGFDEAANANFLEYDRLQRRAERLGPEIQGLSEVVEDPSTITLSRLGQGLAAEAATFAPDLALSAAGALAGTLAAPGAGTIGGFAAPVVARKAAFEVAEQVAKEAAEKELARLATKNVVGEAAERSAQLNARDAAAKAARAQLARTPEAQKLAAQAKALGRTAGFIAGQVPAQTGDADTVALAREGDAGDAATLLAGAVAAASIDAIPQLRALGKLGDQVTGEVVKKTTDRFLTRALKEAGIQAGAEGSTEVVQQAIMNASHALVTENPELLYNGDAMKEYLLSFAVGGIVGGAVGGGIEVSGAAGRQAQRTARQAWDATSKFFENRLRGPVQKDPGVAQNHAQADQTVASTRTPQDPGKLEAARERLSYGYDNARRSDEIKARAEEATRWFNNWKRDDGNRRFSLDGFSNAIVRASGGPEAAVNYRMLEFVDGIDPFVKQLRATGGDQAAADFLARSGSALYRQFTAPQTLTEQDTALLGQLNQYISPQSRDVMSSLAAEWADRSVSLNSAYEREAADPEFAAAQAAEAEGAPELTANEQTQAELEGVDEDSLQFNAMSADAEVDPVNRFVSSRDTGDQRAAIEFLEGPQSNNGKFRTNTFDAERNPAQFNKKRNVNGVLPYGEGKLWDATGHALRLLAQNRSEYAERTDMAPAKAALLDALSQAQAVGMPVDLNALKPGGYRIGGETVRLTAKELRAVRAPVPATPSRPAAEPQPQGLRPPTFERDEFESNSPAIGAADFRLGPRAAPPGAEARAVLPVSGKLPAARRDAQGNIVRQGWEPDAEAGGYRNTETGELLTSIEEIERRMLDSSGVVPDSAPIRGVQFDRAAEAEGVSPEDAELARIGAQVGADVMPDGRPRILGVRSRYIEGADPGTTRSVVAFFKGGVRTEVEMDVFDDLVGYDYKNPNVVARGRAQQRAEEQAQSNAARVSYAPEDDTNVQYDPRLESAEAQELIERKDEALRRLNIDPSFRLEDEAARVRAAANKAQERANSKTGTAAANARERLDLTTKYAMILGQLADLAGPKSSAARAADVLIRDSAIEVPEPDAFRSGAVRSLYPRAPRGTLPAPDATGRGPLRAPQTTAITAPTGSESLPAGRVRGEVPVRPDEVSAAADVGERPVSGVAGGGEGGSGPGGVRPEGPDRSAQGEGSAGRVDRRQSADPGAASVATAPAGQHDLAAEGAYVQGILRGMGFSPAAVTVEANGPDLPDTAGEMRINPDGSITFSMGKGLVGAERIEVLQHEIGHAALLSHIAKKAGIELKKLLGSKGEMPSLSGAMRALEAADPKLYAALKSDYDQWLAKNANKAKGVNNVLGSRGGIARAEGRRARGGAGPRMRDMDQAQVESLVSMEEWIADGVVRALNRNTEAKGITEKFFGELADMLRKAYEKVRELFGATTATPPSIENWVNGMFDAEAKRLGPTTAAGRREIVMRAAHMLHRVRMGLPADPDAIPSDSTPLYDLTVDDLVSDYAEIIRFGLSPEQRGILNRVLSRPEVDAELRQTLSLLNPDPALLAALDDAQIGPEARMAAAMLLQASPKTKLTLGPNASNVIAGLIERVEGWMGAASDADYAIALLDAATNGGFDYAVSANQDPDADERAEFDHVKAHADALRAAGKSTRALVSEGSNKKNGWLQKVADVYNKVVGQSVYERAEALNVPSLRRLVSMLYKPGDVPGADKGLIRSVEHKVSVEFDKTIKALRDLSADQQKAALDVLQRMAPSSEATDPKVQAAVDALRKQLAEYDVYARKAGVKYGYQRDFFPVVMDVESEEASARLATLLSAPNLERGMREFFDALAKSRKETAIANGVEGAERWSDTDDRSTAELIDDMVSGAKRDAEFASSYDDNPRARGAQHRSMAFVYKDGTPEQIAEFAALQSKDIAGIVASYIEPMTRKAEHARRYGNGRLERLFQRAKQEGATPEDIQFARDAIAAAMGTYGNGGSPVLSMVSKGMAQKLHSRGTQKTISNVMAYNNVRLLPLAMLSSLVDPVLIAIRSGGDLGNAFDGIRAGLRAQFDGASKEETARMIDQLGAAADFGAEANLLYALGGLDQAPTARKVNDVLFRYNGMSWLAKATRHMAMHSAHGFLARHATRPNEHSERYLRELGLKPGDVQVEMVMNPQGRMVERVKLDTGRPEVDARVKDAIVRFIDDAVLRPNPIQSPLWHADPYMGLVTQYKGFLYAMWDQVGRRISTEVKNNNALGMFVALLAYAPVAIMAMLMREQIQYGENGNPNRANWDVEDYTAAALYNSGMFGPSSAFIGSAYDDVTSARVPLLSQLGPSAQQATDVVATVAGQRNAGETLQEALPGQVVFEKRFGTEAARSGGDSEPVNENAVERVEEDATQS
jgi:hypothetical protein